MHPTSYKLKENKKQVSELGHIRPDLVTCVSHTDLRSENLGPGREFAVTGGLRPLSYLLWTL
jgi:hypothetical protein